jgi:hypothetical protein
MPDSSEALAGQALSPGAAPFEPAEGGLCSPAATRSLTVDIGAAQDSLPGSASVDQPSRRRSWGPVPGSEPRRALSALAVCSHFGAAGGLRAAGSS